MVERAAGKDCLFFSHIIVGVAVEAGIKICYLPGKRGLIIAGAIVTESGLRIYLNSAAHAKYKNRRHGNH